MSVYHCMGLKESINVQIYSGSHSPDCPLKIVKDDKDDGR